MQSNYTKGLFKSAACFNVLAGLPLLVAMRPAADLMGLEVTPTSALFMQITMALVIMFGWAYWMISRDPVRYRPYIVLGVALKIMVVGLIFGHWLAGSIPWPLPVLASGDILYALLFWRYLSSTRFAAVQRV
jgi:type IV secretory pathway VirB3-like protein